MPPSLGLETNPFSPTAGSDNAPKPSVGNQQHFPDRRAQTRPQIQGQKVSPNLGSEDNRLRVSFAAMLLGIIAQLRMAGSISDPRSGDAFQPKNWGRLWLRLAAVFHTWLVGFRHRRWGRIPPPRRIALLMIFGHMPAAPRGLIFCVFCAHLWVGGGYHACDVRPPVSAPRRGRGRGEGGHILLPRRWQRRTTSSRTQARVRRRACLCSKRTYAARCVFLLNRNRRQ